MEEVVWSSYIDGEIWRELFGAVIIGEGSQKTCLEQLYSRRDIIRSGEIWTGLIKALTLAERYYIGGKI